MPLYEKEVVRILKAADKRDHDGHAARGMGTLVRLRACRRSTKGEHRRGEEKTGDPG
jgi:hypothetical protein